MSHSPKTASRLYGKLLSLYPRTFRERFGESMQQTFDDLYNERRQQTGPGVFGFILRTFGETAIGVFREHLLLIFPGGVMRSRLKTLGASALVSFLLIFPLMLMQLVNRRSLNETFPFVLFVGFWLSPFTIGLMLLPIVQAWRARRQGLSNGFTPQKNTLLTNPRATAVICLLLILLNGLRLMLLSIEWEPLMRLLENPNPGAVGLLVQIFFVSIGFILPIATGIIAGGPIAHTLRAGGSLVAHPFHLIIVVGLSSLITAGFVFLLIDQWPCFIGVPNCD